MVATHFDLMLIKPSSGCVTISHEEEKHYRYTIMSRQWI